MNIQQNVSLASHSTMRLGGDARYLCEVTSEDELQEVLKWAHEQSVPFLMIGSGSNIIWRDEGYDGLVIVNKIKGRKILDQDDQTLTVRFGAGEVWDDAVAWSVDQGLTGIEFLSAIPGSVGAAPVQNIGAYGAELAETLIEVEAYDRQTESFGGMANEVCGFGYRTSRFKHADHGRFIITGIVLKLNKANPQPPFYESLQKYLDEHKVTDFTPATIRQAVIAIRAKKLPDPSRVANNGSFFTNPFVTAQQFEGLKSKYPDIKGWPSEDGQVKVSAAWLVEHAGFRGVHDELTGMATNPDQALVLINEHARTTADLLKFKAKIVDKVQDMFGIELQQEPELLP